MSWLDRTYVQERGPKVTPYAEYAARVKREFKALLDSDPDEPAVQRFLESNPSMVPGSRTPGGWSGHWPLHLALITQPKLHGFTGRVPDFMWLSKHSGTWFPAMIEIERPGKKIFKNDGAPTADFAQASNQLIQWQTWLDNPAHLQSFIDDYGVPPEIHQHRATGRHFILIFGRRAEFNNRPDLSKQRGHLLSGHSELASFDRLSPDKALANAVTVKAIGNGRFEVVAVPEVLAWATSHR